MPGHRRCSRRWRLAQRSAPTAYPHLIPGVPRSLEGCIWLPASDRIFTCPCPQLISSRPSSTSSPHRGIAGSELLFHVDGHSDALLQNGVRSSLVAWCDPDASVQTTSSGHCTPDAAEHVQAHGGGEAQSTFVDERGMREKGPEGVWPTGWGWSTPRGGVGNVVMQIYTYERCDGCGSRSPGSGRCSG